MIVIFNLLLCICMGYSLHGMDSSADSSSRLGKKPDQKKVEEILHRYHEPLSVSLCTEPGYIPVDHTLLLYKERLSNLDQGIVLSLHASSDPKKNFPVTLLQRVQQLRKETEKEYFNVLKSALIQFGPSSFCNFQEEAKRILAIRPSTSAPKVESFNTLVDLEVYDVGLQKHFNVLTYLQIVSDYVKDFDDIKQKISEHTQEVIDLRKQIEAAKKKFTPSISGSSSDTPSTSQSAIADFKKDL